MKKFFLSIITILFSVNLFAAGIDLINFPNINKVLDYEDEINFLYQNLDYLDVWISDDFWKCEISKDEMRNKVKEIYKKVSKKSEPKNQDYLLLKGVISSYLYNLDEPKSFEQTEKDFNAVEKLKEHDYRYKWLLANFYTHAAKPFEAYKAYQYIAERIPEDLLHPDFFYDKAYFENVYQMFENSILDFERYSKYSGQRLDSINMYQTLRKLKTEQEDDEVLDANKVWFMLNRESGKGFYSPMNGIWIPVSEKWTEICTDWNAMPYNGTGMLLFKFTCYDKNISDNVSFTIVVLPERKDFTNSLSEFFASPKINLGFNEKFTTYDASNPEQYPNLGGSVVYATFCSCDYDKEKTLALESPSQQISNGGGLSYYTFKPYYPRDSAKINYLILLDTCQDLKDESLEIYLDFVNNIVIQ